MLRQLMARTAVSIQALRDRDAPAKSSAETPIKMKRGADGQKGKDQ
jgi:hypothetical protein